MEKSKRAPAGAGVYVFLDKNKKPLYVGRAVDLKKRIANYFQKNLDSAKKEMVFLAKNIRFQKTDSLLEAIILEANLIKKYWPKYNIKEKDDRSFVYIIISDFLKIIRGRDLENFKENKSSTRRNNFSPDFLAEKKEGKDKKIKIFGPYQSYKLTNDFLKIIRRIFPYSNCNPNSGKPCFSYQINLCPGVCFDKEGSLEIHKESLKNISLLLEGKKKRLLERLKKNNPEKIKSLRHIQDVALISREENLPGSFKGRIEGYDISHFSGKDSFGAMAVFENGRLDKSQYRLFKIKYSPKGDDLRALSEIISRRLGHKEWRWPDLILVDGGKPQVDFIGRILEKSDLIKKLAGLSKEKKDKLVFPKNAEEKFKKICLSIKPVLISVRDEAHRFANYHRKKKRGLR